MWCLKGKKSKENDEKCLTFFALAGTFSFKGSSASAKLSNVGQADYSGVFLLTSHDSFCFVFMTKLLIQDFLLVDSLLFFN